MMPSGKLRALLIQVRELPVVAQHEQACFLERLGVAPGDLRVHNLITDPQINWDMVADAEVVFIGGAAAHSATEDHAYTQPMAEIVHRLVDAGKPTFGSCWGHQFMARVLGGELITDRDNAEVGTFEIHVTEAGSADPLMHQFPPKFLAHMGHHDHVARLPSGGVELAYSQRCRNQVYRLANKPIYGTQFHAEMSAQRLVERLSFYRDTYLPSDDEFESLKKNPLPTPEADCILHRFLEQVRR
jgi:GMP synthase (glutamine-hydrolysing)